MSDIYSYIQALETRIATLESRIIHMTKPTTLTTDVNTSGAVHSAQTQTYGTKGELHTINILGNYGFASAPLAGCHAQTVSSTGRNDNKLAIASHDPRYHPTGMKAGESQMHDNTNQKVYLSQSGIQIIANSKTTITINKDIVITVEDKKVTIDGDVQVNGTLTASRDVVGGGISLKSHRHLENGKGSMTSAPQ